MSGTVVYVSNADSAEISVLALDEARGTLALRQSMPCGGTVMPLALRPDRRVLYAAIRNEPWRVLAFAIDAREGRLTALGEAPLAQSMAHIAVDTSGRWLFSASYGGGLITLNPLAADGAPQPPCWQQATPPKAHAMRPSIATLIASPSMVSVIFAGSVSPPLSRPSASAFSTACSISRWDCTPTLFRNLRMLMLKVSGFTAPPSGVG